MKAHVRLPEWEGLGAEVASGHKHLRKSHYTQVNDIFFYSVKIFSTGLTNCQSSVRNHEAEGKVESVCSSLAEWLITLITQDPAPYLPPHSLSPTCQHSHMSTTILAHYILTPTLPLWRLADRQALNHPVQVDKLPHDSSSLYNTTTWTYHH